MEWYLAVLRNYVGFSGRARRAEYWWFALFSFIVSVVLDVIDLIIKSSVLGLLYGLAVLLPTLAVGIRRLHDTNRTGWWLLIGIIPIIGWIILIIFLATEGNPGDNQYGPSPKGTSVPIAEPPYPPFTQSG